MKQVKINLTDELDFNEYRKQICFFSQKITSFRREGNSLIIECEDNANTDKIEKKANDALKKNLESKKEDIVIDEHLKKCKYPLLKNCNDDKIFAKARILFNQESEENLYQAGIYVKSAEDKVYYMAIDNDRNCILDTIGENNRKEEFNNTNEYLIKMNLEADCLKVQFISDASTKELKMMIERLAPVEVGLMVKTWGNGGFLEVDFKESQAIISNK